MLRIKDPWFRRSGGRWKLRKPRFQFNKQDWQNFLMILLFIIVGTIAALIAADAEGAAIDELNAQRANLGLPPAVEDPQLTYFAQQKAEWMAAHDIRPSRGYCGHEGPQNPWNYVEGCGDPIHSSDEWVTCAMRFLGNYRVGAGIARGTNGMRYQCVIVGTKKEPRYGGSRKPVITTAHLTPDVPTIPRRNKRIAREYSGTPWTNHPVLGPPTIPGRAVSQPLMARQEPVPLFAPVAL